MSPRTRNWLTAYAVTALIFAVLDVAWILLVANPLYQGQIGGLLAPKANLLGAVLFYVIFVAGMVHYGVRPNAQDVSVRQRVTGAALFGFFTYATWALTGFAVLKDFTALVAVTDILWGAAACSLVTWITATVLRRRIGKTQPA
ncbi:putative membrane protein [Arthrobacter oryzae]|uniref:DUF2177 family protein n=1 Tax=Arthrobacter TaxID=1663 RepID=UPI001F16EB4F|nr:MULTISPECIES: DUF2177 family protein [Arthrobacter]MDP9988423.1 putative membrane protein [Arthrobacter oryzae]UKA72186.1 DUF2177 family protein [Arthrobacter sp. FW306-06-A]